MGEETDQVYRVDWGKETKAVEVGNWQRNKVAASGSPSGSPRSRPTSLRDPQLVPVYSDELRTSHSRPHRKGI
ncbi:hypothetical protein Pmani_017281 [Petrolisthes manimaculis]|uniref:Uncharacterized protein n=1 Tax=Petrolisthes manimaculis TaxID=1843537 RepID=A0AAE1PMS3_9EUCA|nr:hypothetical protein Pmani_017281 [Petrolisthes manimaculis]